VAVIAVLTFAAVLSPSDATAHAGVFESLSRIYIYAISIMLEAAPFVLAGSVAASLAQRIACGTVAVALLAAFAPGCDCAMNGFASGLRRCKPAVAGAALMWGAACNPIALIATATVLGGHVLAARIVGGIVAAATVGVLWRVGATSGTIEDHTTCAPASDIASHLEDGLKLLLPAAFAGSTALVSAPDVLHFHASPFFAAIAGSLLSPCSTADPVLAKALAVSAPAQAAFVVAAQCADVRLLVLATRHFGRRRAALAAVAGAAGCLAAILSAR
jgi:uncharacterized membrane protein YraQ (UPF0718 family)